MILLLILLLILLIIEQQGQKEPQDQNQREIIYNKNENSSNNQNKNPNNNQNENPKNNHNEMQNNNQNSSLIFNENNNYHHSLKEESNKIFEELKLNIPLYMNNMKNNTDSFSYLKPQGEIGELIKEKATFETQREYFEINQNKENRKQIMEKATELSGFLIEKNSSNVFDSNSYILEDKNYKECRNGKKEILSKIIELIKDYAQCNGIEELIKQGKSDNNQENFKYILFLIHEISNNADLLKEGQNEVLNNITFFLEKHFNTYWGNVQSRINDFTDKIDAKQSISLQLFKTSSYLINIQHYDEIDGYLYEDKNMSDFGIIRYEQTKKFLIGILYFSQLFHDFGNGIFNIGSSSILKFDDLKEIKLFDQEQTYNLSEKGIYITFKPKRMMNDFDENKVKFIFYDSPFIPLDNSNDNNNIVRDFICISIFDENGNEINISDLKEEGRPDIYYNQKMNSNIKQCFYFNESKEDSDKDGITSENATNN